MHLRMNWTRRTSGGRTRPVRRVALLASVALGLAAAMAPTANADVTDLLPAISPPGANDFTCRPPADHPAPVVLVHGTFEGAADNWAAVSPQVKAAGYCVFALEYGNRGTGDIAESAAQLARFVDAVLGATGARKVSLVGHSQGGMMPRHYIKFLGGDRKVDDLVGLAPSNHGTTNPGALVAGATVCPACDQQRAGSAFLQQLNAGDETPGGVSYTVVQTRYDEVVTPFTSAFLAGDRNTANILLQDACPAEVIDHHEIPNSALALRWTLHALGRPGPADPQSPPSCV
jgi:triacylglycerol esterase/lipase EstA (alpha/beta hydrolase family)